jgi:hypothetical protein
MNTRRPSCHHPHLRTLLALATILLVACVANAGERGHCLRAEIDETFMLPNGSVHPPGELKLCLIQSLSPVSGAHQTHVNGYSVGYFRSVRSKTTVARQAVRAEPYLEFERNRYGELELRGYSWTDGTTVLAYDLTKLNKKKLRFKVTTRQQHTASNNSPADEQEETIIRLTAAGH